MNIVSLSKDNYDKLKWKEFYDNKMTIEKLPYNLTWIIMFSNIFAKHDFVKINDKLKKTRKNIFPHPRYLFSAFMITPADRVKVVFIGQDPYFNSENNIPQAMGLSFSVPHGIKIPSSLDNIYSNLIKYGHITKKPKSGNLWYWASQGCLMLNTSLTVEEGDKESHTKIWEGVTDYIIKYISDHMNNIVFVLWGGHAYKKINLIDLDKHHTIISSHPSGLSANKPFREYPAFMNEDHFGKINKYLEKVGKSSIMWN